MNFTSNQTRVPVLDLSSYQEQFFNEPGEPELVSLTGPRHSAFEILRIADGTRTCRNLSQPNRIDFYLLVLIKEGQGIYYRLGFNDPSYFSRFYKKQTGISPSAYR